MSSQTAMDWWCNSGVILVNVESRLNLFFELSLDMLCIAGLDGTFKLINPAFQEILGYSLEELQAKPFLEFVHEEDRDSTRQAVAKLGAGKDVVDFVNRYHHKNGDYRWISWRATTKQDEDLIFAVARDITGQRVAAGALKEKQNLLMTVFNTVSNWLYVKGTDGRFLLANRSMAEFHGMEPEALVGKTFREVNTHDPALSDHSESSDKVVLKNGEATEFPEVPMHDRDGKPGFRYLVKIPVKNEAGEVIGLVGNSEDITERKWFEEEMRRKDQHSQAILAALPDLMFVISGEGVIEEYHADSEKMLYDPTGNFVGKKVVEALPPPVAEVIEQAVGKTLRENALQVLEFNLELPHGTACFEARMVPVGTGQVLAIVRDISLSKQAELKLVESERRFKSIFDNSPAAIMLKDTQGNFQMANKVFRGWYGLDDIIGKTSLELFPKSLTDKVIAQEKQVLETGEGSSIEVMVPLGDGTLMPSVNTKFPVRDEQGQVVGVGTIVTDITNQRRTEDQLRQAQKMEVVGQLAGGIAHDFNNLLQIILGYTTQMSNNADLPEKTTTQLQRVETAAKRAADLTRQLLSFSRQQTLNSRHTPLNEKIAQQMNMVRRLISADIELAENLTAEKSQVYTDVGAMEQVLLNLCINARDAMPKGGRLVVETGNFSADAEFCRRNLWAQAGEYLVISVSDDGAGIPREIQSRIFEPFFTTKEVGKGSGLGLAMAYGIVQQHNGHIAVYSEEGVGTTFKIYLPLSHQAPEAQSGDKPAQVAGGSETILVVEDDESVLSLVVTLLEAKGYCLKTATNGQEAIRQIEETPDDFQLVLMDVVMPKMGGREAYEKIKALRPSLPVVFSTGYTFEIIDTAFLEEHRVKMISKPYTAHQLYKTVREGLDEGSAPG